MMCWFMIIRYLVDAFCDGLWLLRQGHVGKFTLQSHEEEIENAVKHVGYIFNFLTGSIAHCLTFCLSACYWKEFSSPKLPISL